MLHGLMHGPFNLGLLLSRWPVRLNALCPRIPQPEGRDCKGAGAEKKNPAWNQSLHARASIMPFMLLPGRPSCSSRAVVLIVRQIAHQSIWIGNRRMPQAVTPLHGVAAMTHNRFSPAWSWKSGGCALMGYIFLYNNFE
ncbi:hypothetical protein [Komagataeibacter xylinus]|uniref:hypothetical protein n=1 Tax=Komagataeibacter xylinus TaxID=28448 RepID=UPI0013EC0546|nr:hypothetical protein [Komagataeibacter xylinus]